MYVPQNGQIKNKIAESMSVMNFLLVHRLFVLLFHSLASWKIIKYPGKSCKNHGILLSVVCMNPVKRQFACPKYSL